MTRSQEIARSSKNSDSNLNVSEAKSLKGQVCEFPRLRFTRGGIAWAEKMNWAPGQKSAAPNLCSPQNCCENI